MINVYIKNFPDILDYSATLAGETLASFEYPWEMLDFIGEFILKFGVRIRKGEITEEYTEILQDVWAGKNVKIAPTASISGPCIIGEGTEIRHCAYIRGNALIGKGCVIGNSTELKNCILFDKTQVPHYNYVGDSILGKGSHLGAASVISNLKSDGKNIAVSVLGENINTGRRKLGAIVGDWADIGCGTVLNPGSIIGKGSRIYPHSTVRGSVPSFCIYKSKNEITPINNNY